MTFNKANAGNFYTRGSRCVLPACVSNTPASNECGRCPVAEVSAHQRMWVKSSESIRCRTSFSPCGFPSPTNRFHLFFTSARFTASSLPAGCCLVIHSRRAVTMRGTRPPSWIHVRLLCLRSAACIHQTHSRLSGLLPRCSNSSTKPWILTDQQ